MNKNLIVKQALVEESGLPIILPQEVLFFLHGKQELKGFYSDFIHLAKLKVLDWLSQKQIAELMGISYPTYLKRRGALEKLGILEVKVLKNNMCVMCMRMIRFSRGKDFYTQGKDSLPQRKYKEILKLFVSMGKSTKPVIPQPSKSDLSHSIYISNTTIPINKPNNVNSTNINNTSVKGPIENKEKQRRFPRENYDIVLKAYQKYKGVKLAGPEVGQALRAVKTMFKADREPKEICDFMKWLRDSENEEGMSWVRSWTLWTVQKKLPEFVAGKLTTNTPKDDYEDITKGR